MRALVMYESMYGNTRAIAAAIGDGLKSAAGGTSDVVVAPVATVESGVVTDVDLLVIGGPTHGHSMSRPSSRDNAVSAADRPKAKVRVEPGAQGRGLREWFDSVGPLPMAAAAFDTRIKGPAWLAGRASRAISRRLRQHGSRLCAEPESFLVTMDNRLLAGEEERARGWGSRLGAMLAAAGGDRAGMVGGVAGTDR